MCVAGLIILGIALFVAGTVVPGMWDAVTVTNCLELIKALAPVVTAIIAFKALKNWQRQDKAKREAEFLDTLIDAAHAYIAEIPHPIGILGFAKIGMESHAPTWEQADQTDIVVKGAIAYIEKYGKEESGRLFQALKALKPSVVRLRSLAAKGQMFNFRDYATCRDAIVVLTLHFGRMEAFAAMLGSAHMNWQHPEVRKQLQTIMAIDPDEIGKSIHANNVALLEFSGETYSRIYGSAWRLKK
jgi:hypothetical protein